MTTKVTASITPRLRRALRRPRPSCSRRGRAQPLDCHGRFFHLRLPELRPAVLTKPHPYVIRAAATEHGMLEIARRGNPFMMNVQNNAVTSARMALYRDTLRTIGLDEATVAAKLDECWVWRNVYVAETDAEAEQIAVPAFVAMHEHRVAMRNRIYAEQKASILPMPPPGAAPPAHASVGARAGLWLAGDCCGETGPAESDWGRRSDHAVPTWADDL